MKKIKRSLLFLAVILALAACGQEDGSTAPVLPESSQADSDSPDSVPAPLPDGSLQPDGGLQSPSPGIVVEDDSLPPREGMVRSRLTNEWVDPGVADTRPIAVMIPNESNAIPHYNLSKASVIYEANVEGRMSRMMAVYEGWQNLEKIGNVRSLRTYYAFWAFEWDAFIVHFGGPYFINDLIAKEDTQNIDGNLDSDAGAFFRTSDRPAPHNGYASGAGLADVIRQKGYPLAYRNLTDADHFRFTAKLNPNTLAQYDAEAKNATYIDMSGCYPLTRCYFEFNEEDGLYYRSQHLSGGSDGPHVDSNGTQLTFKNILVQYIKYEELGEGYLAFQCHDTTRDGWYFTNGKGIHVNWEKTSDYGATRYYDDYGNEIVLNTGKTMICIVEEDDNFTFR
nr:DUF3048 domain-containing protein [uncultured Acetatifactor sp.]